MTRHKLKIWPEYFLEVALDKMRFQLRKKDRDFKLGDVLHLREWDPRTARYTGAECTRVVRYILRDAAGLAPGYCIMSID